MTLSMETDGPLIDTPVAVLFTEGTALTLPVARIVQLTTASMTGEDQVSLPGIADGVQIGMSMTIRREDTATAWPITLVPASGDQMCGVASAAWWRLPGVQDWVTLVAEAGSSAGTINWVPAASSTAAAYTYGPQFPASSTPGRFGYLMPGAGWGNIRRITLLLDAPITAGSITAGVVPSAAGTANPGVTITAGMIAVAEFAPYVAQVGSPSSPAYASAGYTVSAGLVGPSEAWMTVEFW